MSQPGLSKQVRDHQHNSEVFSFRFTQVIYTEHVKKMTQARARVTVQKKTNKKKKKQTVPHQSKWICKF